MKNYTRTNLTFVSANGTSLRLDDIIKGARQYVEKLHRWGYIDDETAEDLMQDAVMKIWRNTANFDETKSAPASYGYLIAKSVYANSWGKNRPVPFSHLPKVVKDDEDSISKVEAEYADDTDLEKDIISKDRVSVIWNAVSRLGEKDGAIMTMALNGYKPKEIAKVIGSTPNAVSIRICRGREFLKGLTPLQTMHEEFRKRRA